MEQTLGVGLIKDDLGGCLTDISVSCEEQGFLSGCFSDRFNGMMRFEVRLSFPRSLEVPRYCALCLLGMTFPGLFVPFCLFIPDFDISIPLFLDIFS